MALTRKEIMAMRKAEYPLNLLYMIQNQLDGRVVEINIENITEDMIRGLDFALSMIDDRGAKILKMKYEERLTTTELVEIFCVKSVNSIADVAVHKLSKPPMIGYIAYGKDGFEKMLDEYRSAIPDALLDKPLEELEPSVGAQWAIETMGVTSLEELVYPSRELLVRLATERFSTIRFEAVQAFLAGLGIRHPLWSLVERKEKSYPNKHPQAGDLYKTVTIGGTEIDIRYRDYDELDLGHSIDYEVKLFDENPEYTKDGFALRNGQDEVCDYFIQKDERSERHYGCESCSYLSDRNNQIGVCGCTGCRQRGVKTPLAGREIHVAVVGELPVAEAIIRDEYENAVFHRYESAADMSVIREKQGLRLELVLIRCNDAEVLGSCGFTSIYKLGGEDVKVPVRLISEPPSYEAELDIAESIVSIAKTKKQA